MKELLWKLLAKVVSIPVVADYLINRSKKTPYFHLPGYMNRWWLFNSYGFDTNQSEAARHERPIKWLPSIRVHHILRADDSRDLHDHPWEARTIILKGWYQERRLVREHIYSRNNLSAITVSTTRFLVRKSGDTAAIDFGEYHSIDEVSEGGVFTLFFTWDYKGTWGFLVDGKKVPWREYGK